MENDIKLNTDMIVHDMSGNGKRIRYTFTSKHGEIIDVELISCKDNYNLLETYTRYGWIPQTQKSWISVDVQATDKKGRCWNKYNPQINKQYKLDFDWVLADNQKNRKKILCEIIKRANKTPVITSIN